jgi:hypothetical protein
MNPSPFAFYVGFRQVGKKMSLYKELGALVMELMYLGIGVGYIYIHTLGKNRPFIKNIAPPMLE